MSTASNSSPTKDWFKGQLISHGIALPASSAKKEEYKRLYEAHVVQKIAPGSEFSSDEEGDGGLWVKHPDREDPIWKWIKSLDKVAVADCLVQIAPPETPLGPVVDSTRALYEKMLYAIVKKADRLEALAKYVRTHPNRELYTEEHNQWIQAIATHGVANETEAVTNGNGNGNEEFSDSDEEDDLVDLETASRASKSSRASSNRRTTPVPSQSKLRATPVKMVEVHRSPAETNIKHRGSAVKKPMSKAPDTEEDEEEGEDEQQENYVARSTGSGLPAETLFMSRMASTQKYTASTFSSMKREYPLGAGTGPSNRDDLKNPPVGDNTDAKSRSMRTMMWSLVLLLICVAMPFVAYYVLANKEEAAAVAPPTPPDELDEILNGMNGPQGGA